MKASATGSNKSLPQRPKPRPRAASNDEDEAVEIAWGSGEREHNSGTPLLLDEVPDFSDKLVGLDPGIVIDPNIAIDSDLLDDIPTTGPSHGHPSRPPRDTAPTFNAPLAAQGISTPPPLPLPPPPAVRGLSQPFVDRRRPDVPAIPPDGRERRNTATGTGTMPRVTPAPEELRGRPARSLTELAGLPPEAPDAPDTEPAQPAVTFRPAHLPRLDGEDPHPPLSEARVPSTKPGVKPARASTAGFARVEDFEGPATRSRRPSSSQVTIGSSIVARQSVKRGWVYGVAALGVGVVIVGALLLANREPTAAAVMTEPPATKTVAKQVGTLKFAIEPPDAEIAIEGKTTHVGSPWAIELEPGMYQIRIHHKDYKARLKTVELSPSETLTLDLGLEKLGRNAAEAKLILGSTPGGLEVLIDGKALPDRTPVTANVKPGKHTIVMRQNGVEVWRQDVQAQAGTDHEFSPSMSEAKQRERAQRIAGVPTKRPDEVATRDKTVDQTPKATEPDPKVEPKPTDPKLDPKDPKASGTTPFDPKPPTPTPPPPTEQPKVPAPAPAPVQRGPVNVAPHTVERIAGDAPTFKKARNAELPAMVNAKLCIDPGGRITSVDVLSKQLERSTIVDMMATIRGWRYEPYKQNGTAIAVCFVVPFRLK